MASFPLADFVVFVLTSHVGYGTTYYIAMRIVGWVVAEQIHRPPLSLY
jgi:hypothetical protein